jgi:hypothetical protein
VKRGPTAHRPPAAASWSRLSERGWVGPDQPGVPSAAAEGTALTVAPAVGAGHPRTATASSAATAAVGVLREHLRVDQAVTVSLAWPIHSATCWERTPALAHNLACPGKGANLDAALDGRNDSCRSYCWRTRPCR